MRKVLLYSDLLVAVALVSGYGGAVDPLAAAVTGGLPTW